MPTESQLDEVIKLLIKERDRITALAVKHRNSKMDKQVEIESREARCYRLVIKFLVREKRAKLSIDEHSGVEL